MTIVDRLLGDCRFAVVVAVAGSTSAPLLRRGDERGVLEMDLISLRKVAVSWQSERSAFRRLR
jgi:hypothetical protein